MKSKEQDPGLLKALRHYQEKYRAAIEEEYHRLQKEKLPELTEELFSLFERTGNRLEYEHAYFGRRRFLTITAMQAVIRQEAVPELEEILREICQERCWALPAHVDRSRGADWELAVDLFASETAQTLTEISVLLGEALSEELKSEIRREVLCRVIRPFMKQNPYAFWEHEASNWNAVCCGSIGAAALYLLKKLPGTSGQQEEWLLLDCLIRVREDLTHYPDSFSEDGACMEGLGYWEYGMSYFVLFADLVREHSSGQIDLLADSKIRRMMEFQQKCYFVGGRTLSFSDGDSRGRFRVGLASRLAVENEKVKLPPLECALLPGGDPCWRWAAACRDWIWTVEYIQILETKSLKPEYKKDTGQMEENAAGSEILADAQWAIFQGRCKTAAAVKGGHNTEPHNHNDVGSFLYYMGDREVISDLGAGEYTKAYFSEERYQILCNSSEGHSVPVINGEFQLPGSAYGADRFIAKEDNEILISFAGAYRKQALQSLCRRLKFEPDTGSLLIEDTFAVSEQTRSFTENLVTRQRPKICGNQILFAGGGRVTVESCGSASVKCPERTLDETFPVIWVEEREHRNHEGKAERVFLIRWEVPFDKEGGSCRFRIEPETTEKREMGGAYHAEIFERS